jgi:ATP-dependent Clp protease protease subunit
MILKIYSAIMPEEDRMFMQFMGLDGVSFKSIDEFIASVPDDDDTIDMRINSPGGVVPEGWAIIDKLRATGKKITATIEGDAASMAAIVLLAASERRAYKHARLLIHDAYFPEYTLAGAYRAEDLEKLAASLEEDNQRALDFMVERTGADRATLEALMKEDKFIDMEQAKELGFIHEILEPASASAKSWKRPSQTHSSTDMSNKKTIASALKAFAEALGLSVKMEDEPAPVGYVLVAQDGTEINIDKPEGEDPAVGDAASPDGEFLMPDGTTIVVADGVISEIRDAEAEETEAPEEAPEDSADGAHQAEIAAKDAEIASLQARIAELEANQMSAEQQTILAKVEKAGGSAWLEKATQSNYKPAQRSRQDQTVEPKASKTGQDLAAIKERRAARRKKAE